MSERFIGEIKHRRGNENLSAEISIIQAIRSIISPNPYAAMFDGGQFSI